MKKRTTKIRVPRTRNGGTMTEAAFFQWLRQKLRKASMYWKPVAQVRKAAQIPYKGKNTRRRYSYLCADCKGEFSALEVNIHHVQECGALSSFDDLSSFAERLFCEKEGLVCLCSNCHDKRHNKINTKENGKHIIPKRKNRTAGRTIISGRKRRRATGSRSVPRKNVRHTK